VGLFPERDVRERESSVLRMADPQPLPTMRAMLTQDQLEHVDRSAIQRLRTALHGELVTPADADYHQARRVWNAHIDKHPALIARCAGESDVVRAVQFAREHDLRVAVRGGGHNVAGYGTCDDGLVIDLSPMKGLRIDGVRRTALAQPGLRLGEFDQQTQAAGLATPLGIVANTGIAGLTLGGGVGWLNGAYGLACDNLLSAHVVTADGQLLTASADEHTDLLWGLRGGGGNFGIVTLFEYQLRPVAQVLGGMAVYAFSDARAVLRRYGELCAEGPDELTTAAFLIIGEDGQPAVAIAVCYCGELERGEVVVKPYRALGSLLADLIKPMSYVEQQGSFDAGFPPDRMHYWKGAVLRTLDESTIDVLLEFTSRMPSAMSGIGLQHVHGAASRVARDATAFPHRFEFWDAPILAQWADPADSEAHIAWAREAWAALAPLATDGVYVNNLGVEGHDRVQAAYGDNYSRLVALKTAYDPDNFFRLNQNIPPEAVRAGS
jgi:FAD/FMN-containing dehydrogenase